MNKAQQKFRRVVWQYYRQRGRSLPWRETTDAYAILVSEVMLQQTQVDRVIPKHEAWLDRFGDWDSLSRASLADVLTAWQGLGYNRRAQNLQRCAQAVIDQHRGVLPKDEQSLRALPGIGPYTAAAVQAFAHNKPVTMIETNIRTVFLHHFLTGKTEVSDDQLLPLITATVSAREPRKWYWALMDYGAHLKQEHGNTNTRSKHYVKQSAFVGSNRQVRGRIIALLTTKQAVTRVELLEELQVGEKRAEAALAQLQTEGLVATVRGRIRIA
ncbi:endonuclease III [bacterium]|nr:endonuclease III [bacterium]